MIDCLLANWQFYACIGLAAVLSFIPIIGKFLNVLNTLFHESAHALVALLTGGGVMNIKLSADASGTAQTKSKYWLGKVLTSLAGYPISSLTAWLFFWLIKVHKVKFIFYIMLSLIMINLVLWVRNTFGLIWLLLMGCICGLVYLYTNQELQYYFVTFCAGIVLFQSIYSAITLFIISIKSASKAGDAKNLKDFTFIPAVIWALLFVLISFWVAFMVFKTFPCITS